MRSVVVEVRNKSLSRVGRIPDNLLNFEMTIEYNSPGTWKVTLPTTSPLADELARPGSGIVVSVDGVSIFSGPTTNVSKEETALFGTGTVEASGVGDSIILWESLAFPDPTNPDPSTQALAHDTRTGVAEDLIISYIDANIGPSGKDPRKNVRLTLPTSQGRGVTQTRKARFEYLGDLAADIADTSALSFRVAQTGAGTLGLIIDEVADRSLQIRMSTSNGLSRGSKVNVSAPNITRAIVAGQGDLVARAILEQTTADSVQAESDWGRRIERWVDRRDLETLAGLAEGASSDLRDGGKTVVSANAVLSESDWYGAFRDWYPGDQIAVVVDGVELKTTARGAVVKADEGGVRFGMLLGDEPDASSQEAFAKRLIQARSRISSVERRSVGVTSFDSRYLPANVNNTSGVALTLNMTSVRETLGTGLTYSASGWTVARAGVYDLSAICVWAANGSGTRKVAILVNGVEVASSTVNGTASAATKAACSRRMILVANDVVTITALQNSGSTLAIQSGVSNTSGSVYLTS